MIMERAAAGRSLDSNLIEAAQQYVRRTLAQLVL